jgi:hypothetical protein
MEGRPVAFLYFRFGMSRLRVPAVFGKFFTVDRSHVRRIFVKIRPPDTKLLFVGIDPLPQFFA